MKQLNVRQLSAMMETRQARRHQCFEKVLELCFTQVKRHADKNAMFCFFEVPDFLLGFPLYDLNECIAYVVDKLQKNEFLVRYYFPRILYISWNVNEIKEEKLRQNMSLIHSIEGPKPQNVASAKRRGRVAVATKPKSIIAPTTASLNNTLVPQKAVSFVKSVKEFKPSGKIVLDL